MQDNEVALLSKTIDIIRQDIQNQMAEIKSDVHDLKEEYDAVFVEQKAAKLAAEIDAANAKRAAESALQAAELAKLAASRANSDAQRLKTRVTILTAIATTVFTGVPAVLYLLHLVHIGS
jgi:DNA-binding transcriptional regulator YbjK